MSLNLMQHSILTGQQMFSAQSVCYKNSVDWFKGIKIIADDYFTLLFSYDLTDI